MMIRIFVLLIIFSLTFDGANGQSKKPGQLDKKLIDTTGVEYITITGGRAVSAKNKKLSKNQIKALADRWNSAEVVNTIKPMNNFRIDIYLKKGKRRTLSGAGNLISENGKIWYDMQDSNFIDILLTKAD